jgi:DNA-binding response OmpR family regulator
MQLLLIDDDRALRLSLATALRAAGHVEGPS